MICFETIDKCLYVAAFAFILVCAVKIADFSKFLLFLSCLCLQVRKGLFPMINDPPKYPEKILFCGWRRDIEDMILVGSSCLFHVFHLVCCAC